MSATGRETSESVTNGGGTVKSVTPEELHDWMERDEVFLVDVREPMEHERESIPGSVLQPAGDVGEDLLRRARGRRLVVHCQSGNRSSDACRALQPVAEGTIYNLEGGLRAWKQAGYGTDLNESAPIGLQRQVQIAAGTLVLAGTLAGWLFSRWFLLVPLGVGTGLLYAGLTGNCGMTALLTGMPWNQLNED